MGWDIIRSDERILRHRACGGENGEERMNGQKIV